MAKTYVISPNFSMAPPPRLRRPDETPELAPVPMRPATGPTAAGTLVDEGIPAGDELLHEEAPADEEHQTSDDDKAALPEEGASAPNEPTLIPTAAAGGVPANIPPYHPLVELQLGDVLTNPFGAELEAKNRDCRVSINPNHLEKMGRTGHFSDTRQRLLNGRLGVWASLLAAVGAGPDINAAIFWESRSNDVIEMDELETRRFRVTKGYVEEVLASTDIQKHLVEFPNADLWMVSGMKVAKGARQNSSSSFSLGADVGSKENISGSELKLLKLLWKRSSQTAFRASSEFILAVQLRHIKLAEGKLVRVTLSEKHASMADGGAKGREIEVANAEYDGLDDSLSGAEEQFIHGIERKEDEEGAELLTPDLDGDLSEDEVDSEEEDDEDDDEDDDDD